MNKKIWIIAILLAAFWVVFATASYAITDTKGLWKLVDKAEKDGLPKTAIDNLKKIYKITMTENREGEALKALTMQITLESIIEGNKPEYKITRLKEEIEKTSKNLKPILKTILAQWYWQYYDRNSYRFLDRTETQGVSNDDFITWDLPKLFKEISTIYQDLLKDEENLKQIKISAYYNLLEKGNLPEKIRPTLFDFVAFKAIDFYSLAEQAKAYPRDAFEIDAETDAFGAAEKFIDFTPETTDTNSPKLLAIQIFQKILKYHLNDKDPDAFLDGDLKRLNYIYNYSYGTNKEETYIERLKEIINNYGQSELSSLAYYYWANLILNKDDYVKAYKLAEDGCNYYPKSYGGLKCAQIMETITSKYIYLKSERVINPSLESNIILTYNNIDEITFRIYKDNWQETLNVNKSLTYLSEADIKTLLKAKPVTQWTEKLKQTSDYKEKTTNIAIPKLEKGFYRVLASYKKDFSEIENSLTYCTIWVSDIALITREKDEMIDGFVLDSTTGDPIENAAIKVFRYTYKDSKYVITENLFTDENGYFSFSGERKGDYSGVKVYAEKNGTEYVSAEDIYSYKSYKETKFKKAVFFTDRAIYRPGQTIHFKGILLSVNQDSNDYKVIPNEKVIVSFCDTNNQEISKLNLSSNDFGSFSGSFTAPKDRLTGQMSIVLKSPKYQSQNANIRVEEYKRPKFTVEIKAPEKAFRLNDDVLVSGEAIAYTGAKIDSATVSYRVVRQVRMPYWWAYFSRFYNYDIGSSQEIANGTTTTDVEGKFMVTFKAKPDLQIPESSSPSFVYSIYADVTDTTGETISGETSIRLGYTSIEANISCNKFQSTLEPVKIKIDTQTLDGMPVTKEGVIEIKELIEPSKPVRENIFNDYYSDDINTKDGASNNTSNWEIWPEGKTIDNLKFKTAENGYIHIETKLNKGAYRLTLHTKDNYGKDVKAILPVLVADLNDNKFSVKVPSYYAVKSERVEAGDNFKAIWGTGYDYGRVFVEIMQNGKYLKKYWTTPSETQHLIDVPVTENLRGGFTVLTTYVRENRLYSNKTRVTVPWSNKKLDIKFETFRSKLYPGQKETWTLKIKGPQAEKEAAEMAATLYDESLDSFIYFSWPSIASYFKYDYQNISQDFSNKGISFTTWINDINKVMPDPKRIYVNFPQYINQSLYGYDYAEGYKTACPPPCTGKDDEGPTVNEATIDSLSDKKSTSKETTPSPQALPSQGKLSKTTARKNLNETAFFFPHLLTEKDGTVKITFQMPEALTKWRFMGFAHTKDMKSGTIWEETVTQKDIMVQPNPPRFLREGDILEFTVKVTNMTEKNVTGSVRLTFFDPETEKSLDTNLQNTETDKKINIPAKQSRTFSWKINVPDGVNVAAYKAVAATEKFSDGEEGVLPILSRRIFITESIPLWIRGASERKFTFEKLIKSSGSNTLENKRYVIQMTSNPSWYAIQALPYLMEFPHECSEQVFNRLYANSVAKNVADSDPKIRKVFDAWKGTPALKSNLEKNEDLKGVQLLDTPWVLDAKNETDAKQKVGLLFDDNRLNEELQSTYNKLKNMQFSDGAWPWFPGGERDSFITLYIMTGFGKLKSLNINNLNYDLALNSLNYMDKWISNVYNDIVSQKNLKGNNLSTTIALYLYGRSFFLEEKPIPQNSQKAVNYFLEQANLYWLKLDSRMSQGHLALALNRMGDKTTAQKIMASIKERSKSSEELGMYWGEDEFSWWWYRAPIETQAVMIEAFDEITNDQKAVEDCKVWLLKQKQTTNWKTTKATSDSIYALILRGENLLASDKLTEVSVGGQTIKPDKAEEGTGFYEKIYEPVDIKPEMGEITVKKEDAGISWGGAYWQYLEDMSKVTPNVQGPLKLTKTLFVQKNTGSGIVITPVKDALSVGDIVVVRIELRTDRDMEYVHMKDQRGSGFEPINVLSKYKYQDGLRYYESTKDTATHFYIDYLPKGTYVFEYQIRVVHKGTYQTGISEIECMYAPEFSSHSESFLVDVK